MKILNPVAAPRGNSEHKLLLVPGFQGLRLAILTNHWKSMDRMSLRMSAGAKEKYSVAAVQLHDIPINGPMAEVVERRVLSECDVAIVGLAN